MKGPYSRSGDFVYLREADRVLDRPRPPNKKVEHTSLRPFFTLHPTGKSPPPHIDLHAKVLTSPLFRHTPFRAVRLGRGSLVPTKPSKSGPDRLERVVRGHAKTGTALVLRPVLVPIGGPRLARSVSWPERGTIHGGGVSPLRRGACRLTVRRAEHKGSRCMAAVGGAPERRGGWRGSSVHSLFAPAIAAVAARRSLRGGPRPSTFASRE